MVCGYLNTLQHLMSDYNLVWKGCFL